MEQVKPFVLVVDKDRATADQVKSTYGTEFEFQEVEHTNSVRKAIEALVKSEFNLVVLSERIEEGDLAPFFRDYNSLELQYHCAVVQLKEKVPEGFDQSALTAQGFATAISMSGTHSDRECLQKALEDSMFEAEVVQKKINVGEAIDVAMKELDNVARERKRGKHRKFNTLSTDFVALQTDFDEQVMKKYYEELWEKTLNAEPEKVQEIEVPDKVLDKKLPNLENNNYTGASARVWRKLMKRYGKEEEPVQKEASAETSEVSPQRDAAEEPVDAPVEDGIEEEQEEGVKAPDENPTDE